MSGKARTKRSLLSRLSGDGVLLRAAYEVTRGANPESAGPDGVTIDVFRRSLKSHVKSIQAELRASTYQSQQGRGVAIITPSTDGVSQPKVRGITVFSIRDRVVHRAVANIIWPHLRPIVDSEVSFGGIRSFRPHTGTSPQTVTIAKKNVRAAAAKILYWREQGKTFVFETDIQKFFPTVNKSRLLRELQFALPDDSLMPILSAAVATAVSNSVELEAQGLSSHWDPDSGVPQGGVLSPLLANFYLAPFDIAMKRGGFALVRYVDDFVVPASTEAEAIAAHRLARDTLTGLGLSIHELNKPDGRGRVKTRIVPPGTPFDFLGLRFNKRSIQPAQDKVDDLKDRLKRITHARLGSQTLVDAITRLNQVVRGWMSAYGFCNMSASLITEIDHSLGKHLASWMTYHDLLRSENALTDAKRARLGLWSARLAKLEPLIPESGSARRSSLKKH